jgi:DNA-binding NarL/FixJ family response regulator
VSAAHPKASNLSGAPLRIVIADDHEPTRVLLRTLIELTPMHVVGEAEDGKTAIALALEHDPDIVLLDINMPGLDGLGAAEIIRTRRPRIHIVLHTCEPLDTTRNRAAALHLPLFDKRDLHRTIEQLAAVSQPQRSASQQRARHPFVSSGLRPAGPAGGNRRATHRGPPLALVPALSERRRAENQQNLGLVSELRCECEIPDCRETFPAAADRHRGTADRFIVAPAHLNGGTPVKVADRFFVINESLRATTGGEHR